MGNRHRNRAKQERGNTQRNGHGLSAPPTNGGPPKTGPTDASKVWITREPEPMPPADDGGHSQAGSNYDASAGNGVRHGRRAKAIFPEQMATMIDERFREFVVQEHPETSLQVWVVYELARATVQLDAARNQGLLDLRRVLDRANSDLDWSADAEERVDRLSARLPKDPYTVARALERTKQGASFLLYNYKQLADAIKESGQVTEEQRQLLFDLGGVPHALRTGTQEVPDATDGPRLAALVAEKSELLQSKLDTVLNHRDRTDQLLAQIGLFKHKDSISRTVKADESRAQGRVKWAWQTLQQLRAGADPATLFDSETNEALDPAAQAPAATRSKPAPAASPPPPPPPPPPSPPRGEGARSADEEASPPPSNEADPEPSPPRFWMPPIPEGCPEDARLMLTMLAEAYHNQYRAPSGAAPLPSDDPLADPGPPSA